MKSIVAENSLQTSFDIIIKYNLITFFHRQVNSNVQIMKEENKKMNVVKIMCMML